jgi:ABC-type sugar transport system ATPase subunit
VLERLGLAIDPDRAAGSLPPNQQQMVEIARAISVDARVVILDEPTSSLADDEVEALFTVVRTLRRDGVATLFVSHRLEEVFAIVDRVTVLRDGQVVGAGPLERYDRGGLIRLMIGRDLEALTLGDGRHVVADPVLRVRDLHLAGGLGAPAIDLDVGRGEVVGLAGLVGAGRSEVFDALFGVLPPRSGRIEVDAAPVAPRSPRDAMRAGFGYVPADRKRLGVVLDMSVRENLLMASTAGTPRLRRVSPGPEQAAVRRATAEFGIVAASPGTPVARLSGGNQQKVVLAKWLATEPRVLLLDEPTRGVDVGAKAEIYKLLQRAKEAGVGILISSSETPELRLLCDRILVMRRGRIVAALDREDATEARIAHFAMGAA